MIVGLSEDDFSRMEESVQKVNSYEPTIDYRVLGMLKNIFLFFGFYFCVIITFVYYFDY